VAGIVQSALANTGTWADPESNNAGVELTASIGTVVKNANGTWSWSHTPTTYLNNVPVTITASDGVNSSEVTFNITANTFAAGRSVFYNNATGANLSSAGAANNAIDTSKSVLRTPGATSTFANYTNYSRGLNGLIVDIAGLPTTVTDAQMLTSLQFANWDAISASGFAALPGTAIPTVTILSNSGVGGSARVKITFPDNTLQNTWLRVTVLANANTGLAADDVFYFGNVIGELDFGNTATRLRVNGQDVALILANQSPGANTATVTNKFDLDRNGRVNGQDYAILLANQQAAGIVAPLTIPGARPANRTSSGSTEGGANVGDPAGKDGTSLPLAGSSSATIGASNSKPTDSAAGSGTKVSNLGSSDGNASLPVVSLRVVDIHGEIVDLLELDSTRKKKSSKSLEVSWNDAFFASLGKLDRN
jgi:hypothetical protein